MQSVNARKNPFSLQFFIVVHKISQGGNLSNASLCSPIFAAKSFFSKSSSLVKDVTIFLLAANFVLNFQLVYLQFKSKGSLDFGRVQ
jgi:hypothetical protein